MEVENLIYAYLLICCSMILFNCACIVIFKRSDQQTDKKSKNFEKQINKQINLMQAGQSIEAKHQAYLSKKLNKVGNLIAFDETIERLYDKDAQTCRAYLIAIFPVFLTLARKYAQKDSIESAYFPYMLKRFHILQEHSFEALMDILMELLSKKSLYCRENALQAIYSSGQCLYVVKALKIIDQNGYFHHSKLISDGLLEFAGDHEQLANALWQSFDDFSVAMKVSLLNYLRFGNSHCAKEMMELLEDETQDDEIRFACIRYLGKYHYEPAHEILLNLAENKQQQRFEYPAIASSALALYPATKTIAVLKQNLYSPNWYIRFNASSSLEQLGVSYADLMDVFDGNDRYAREILQYRFDQRHAKEAAHGGNRV